MPEPKKHNVTQIRDLDKKLYKQARVQALKEGRPVYVWLNEAIKEKLERSKGK